MDYDLLWNLISAISPILLLIGIIVGLKYINYLAPSWRLILAYLVVCLVVDLLYRYLGFYSHSKYNLFMIPIFGFLELSIFSVLYYKYIFQNKSKSLLIFIVTILLLILYEVISTLKSSHKESFHSYGKVVADASIVFFCLIYYWRVVKGQIPINSEYNFLNSVVFVYYSVNLLLYLPVNFLVNAKLTLVIFFWVVNLISMVLFYLILIYLIWQNGKTLKISR